MENKFCYLKGVVDCESGVIQNCNNMRITECPLEQAKKEEKIMGQTEKEGKSRTQTFCYLKGLVDCSPADVQDCNNKRAKTCPKE